ncbi:MAG: hypothetical protein FD180_4517 [Planctomycetota bacterium]|nr:MAG: hypothetical protein FD180_4517 [Planctomycetota bacterium]
MRRPLVIAFVVLALAGLGAGGYFAFWAGTDEREEIEAHSNLMKELAGKRDRVTLVISGRIMAEIFPCG